MPDFELPATGLGTALLIWLLLLLAYGCDCFNLALVLLAATADVLVIFDISVDAYLELVALSGTSDELCGLFGGIMGWMVTGCDEVMARGMGDESAIR